MASVTIRQRDDRWYVRWREPLLGPDGVPLRTPDGRVRCRERERRCSSKDIARELAGEVTRALEREGAWVQPGAALEEVAEFDAAALAWWSSREARGAAPASLEQWRSGLARLFADIRKERRLPPDRPVPVSVLSRELVTDLLNRWQREGLGESRRYELARLTLSVWTWVADDPVAWPGCPPAPRDRSHVIPPAPVRPPAPPSPTWAELDAVIRRVSPWMRDLVVVLRCTGLRIGQVTALEGRDLWMEPDGPVLRVRVGKSRAERAERRVIPVADEVWHLLQDRVGRAELVFPGGASDGGWSRQGASHALRDAWEDAAEAAEVRREVFAPEDRRGRPAHGFRAGFLGGLTRSGVPDVVLQVLVGHRSLSTLRGHYAGADTLREQLRAAVRLVPPVDYVGAGAERVVRLDSRR